MAGTPLNRNWMSLCLEIILFGRFLQQDQGLPSHVPGTIWLCSTQFWLNFLGFSSILKGTPCMLCYVHIWAGTLSTLLLSLISKGIITTSVYIPSDLYQIQWIGVFRDHHWSLKYTEVQFQQRTFTQSPSLQLSNNPIILTYELICTEQVFLAPQVL